MSGNFCWDRIASSTIPRGRAVLSEPEEKNLLGEAKIEEGRGGNKERGSGGRGGRR